MRVSLLVLLMLPFFVMAQDILIKRDGKEVKTRILRIDKKQITYKLIDDPEFQTVTVEKKDVRMIRMEAGKVYNFDNEYPLPYIGLGGGAFLPTGKFHSTRSGEGYTPGYARIGANFKLSAGLYLKKKIGIPIEVKMMHCEFDDEDYLKSIQSPNGEMSSIEFDGGAYVFFSLQSGLMYSTFLGSKGKTVLDFKALGGFMYTTNRESRTTYIDNGNQTLSSTTKFNSKGFLSYGAGVNFRYMLSKRIGTCLFADLIMATPELSYNRTTNDATGINNNLGGVGSSMVRSVSGVNTGLSLYYHFNRR